MKKPLKLGVTGMMTQYRLACLWDPPTHTYVHQTHIYYCAWQMTRTHTNALNACMHVLYIPTNIHGWTYMYIHVLINITCTHTHTCTERIKQTVSIDATTVDIEEKGVKLRLTVVDTPGFGDAVDNRQW